MNKDRIACVLIPNFSMAVCLRIDSTLCDQPVVLAQGNRESSPICAVNKKAAALGVSASMTVGQAMSYCPELVVKERAPKREAAASEKIRDLLFTASPLIEETKPGCYFLDASGLRWLYKNEEELAGRLISLIDTLKLPVQVGVASNKFVAKVAALVSPEGSHTVVEPNTERRLLNHLAIDYLPLFEETRENFLALGLKTIGQVAAFLANEMAARFGEEGKNISRLSRGDDVDFFVPEFARVRLSSRTVLFEPLRSAQAIVAHVEEILTGLMEKLNRNDRGCAAVEVKLHLDDKTDESVRLALRKPVGLPQRFIRLLIDRLNGLKLTSPVTDITITIPEVLPLVSSQLDLLGTAGSFKSRLLEDKRIGGELGQVSMLSPVVGDAIIPDNNLSFFPIGQNKKSTNGKKTDNTCFYSLSPVAGLRILQPPLKTDVVTLGKKLRRLQVKNKSKAIIEQKGPWQLSGGWWNRAFDRLYYEVETGDHQMYLLYFDRQTPGWYVQGVFD